MDFYNGKKYIINLQRRTDRRDQIVSEMIRYAPLNYEIFNAIEGGAKGCLASHLAIIRLAKQADLPYVIILEDDCEFIAAFSQMLPTCLNQLPGDWDMLYFGANHKKPLWMMSDNMGKCIHTLSTSSYAVKQTAYDLIISHLSTRLDGVIDEIYRDHIHPVINAYGIKPTLIYQRAGFSDIEGVFTDFKSNFDNPVWR